MEFVCIDELVPKNHLLRKVDANVDFGFIHDLVAPLYCPDNGRPALDPTRLFKMLLLGYLMGVRSERRLVEEIKVNVAYRWFLGLSLTDKVPDASTLSQNRRRRFNDSDVYQQIFDEIVLQAMQKRLVGGQVLYTDSTHLKASANKHKHRNVNARADALSYLEILEEAVEEDRLMQGKKPLPKVSPKLIEREIKQSTTDPDSGYMVRDNKPKGFFYLDHRTTDAKANIMTDVHVTAGNVHDSRPYLNRLDRQQSRFGFEVQAVGLDAGYMTAGICRGLEDRDIYGVIGYRRPNHKQGYFYKREYQYDPESDSYLCPMGQRLIYKTTSRDGYRHYHSDKRVCGECTQRERCTRSANMMKVIARHVWEGAKERIHQHRLSDKGKVIYARRKETVERSFADAKELHGYRYARYRGLYRVKGQCLLTAAAQNIKKIALMAS